MNNGASWIEAEKAIEVSTVHIKAAVSSFQPASVIDHLRMKSPHEICAISLYPPIYIPTETLNPNPNLNPIYIPTDTLTHPNITTCTTKSNIRNSDYEVRPILDVVGLKICSFQNAIAATKMLLSAQTVVDS
jgi:hypothetical protein